MQKSLEKADQAERATAGVARRMTDMEFETKRIFDKLQKDSDEMHTQFSKLKEDIAQIQR